jgi:cell division protein FtsB
MSLLHDTSKRLKSLAVPFLGISATIYFAYHIFQGDRGLLAWWKLQKQVVDAEFTAATTGTRKTYLENRVRLLTPSSIDPDMLEERARLMLNYGHSNEVVILDPERRK